MTFAQAMGDDVVPNTAFEMQDDCKYYMENRTPTTKHNGKGVLGVDVTHVFFKKGAGSGHLE